MKLQARMWIAAGLVVLILSGTYYLSAPVLPQQRSKSISPNVAPHPNALAKRQPAAPASTPASDRFANVRPRDFPAKLLQLEAVVDLEERRNARLELLSQWAQVDITSIALWFDGRTKVDQAYQDARDIIARALAGDNPATAFVWIENHLTPSCQQELSSPFFKAWTSYDPVAATARLVELSATKSNPDWWNDLLGQAAAQWAYSDLKSALPWAKALPSGNAKMAVLQQIAYGWVESAPDDAAEYAATQDSSKLLNLVTAKWAEKDPAGASEWVKKQTAGERRSSCLASISSVWAQKDPNAAATFAASLSTMAERERAMLAVTSVWAYPDPGDASAWAKQLPENHMKEVVVEQITRLWTDGDAAEAANWLQSLAPGRSRDAAIGIYCKRMDSMNPPASFAWAERIVGETLRNQCMERAAISWLGKEPNEARRAIQASRLPETTKRQLLIEASQSP